MNNIHFTKLVQRIQRQMFMLHGKKIIFFSISAPHTKVPSQEHELHPPKNLSRVSTPALSFHILLSQVWQWANLPWKVLLKHSSGGFPMPKLKWNITELTQWNISLSLFFHSFSLSLLWRMRLRVRKIECIGGKIWFSRVLEDLGFILLFYKHY